ncbi:MAG: type VI secretion system membrane subunit TssM [Acetobacteraceae bacterium]
MRNLLLSRWTMTAAGTLLLATLVWLFGPFLPQLDGWLPRAAIILGLIAVWGTANLMMDWHRRRRDKALAEGVAEPDPTAIASAEEAAALRERLTRAMTLLRQARGTRGWLYEQPWYAIIGPPGAGKTTALLNAGLRFPLTEELGQEALPGVGGTRQCDWWFTDEAVLIDTVGRYTTQDSDAAVDRAGWDTFLDLLKRTRGRQPLNGVIVAVSLTEIGQSTREARLAQATTIRRRMKELRDRLGVRLPVYVLFTKADLIAGFSEFFDDLDAEKRTQVWGTTFALDVDGPSAFPAAFAALVANLNDRQLDRMQAERSPERRALIAGFPSQVASLAAPLQEFLELAFAGSRLDPAPLLRGAYLCSGTQEGTPIDRLTAVLSRGFGIDQRLAPSLRPESGRGYFLNRLVREVILGEAMLVSEPPNLRRRRRLVHAGACAAVLLASLATGGLLWRDSLAGQADIGRLATALDTYRQHAEHLSLDPVRDGNLAAVLPLLDEARDLPFRADRDSGLGLSQQGKLGAASREVYRNVLARVLLPRLIWRLESQMRAALDRPDFLYQATRVYLMLGGEGPLDRDLVRAWMKLDWERDYPGASAAPIRDSLAGHLDALLAEPLPAVALDGALVESARVTFSRVPVAQRIYSRIVPSAAAQHLAPWRPADALGAAGATLFRRSSGKPLTDGIPGLYTAAGYRDVLLSSVPAVARQVAGESWVLGKASEIDASPQALRTLEADVVKLYEADFTRQWNALLADLVIMPGRTPQQAAQALFVLGSPQSPIRALLTSVVQAVTVTAPAEAAPGATATTALRQVLGQPGVRADDQAIDARFKALRDYVGQGSGAPIEAALAAINTLQQSLVQLAAAQPGAPVVQTGDPLLALRAAASQAPQPVQRWLLSLAADGAALRAGGLRQQAAASFNGAGGPAQLCAQAVKGRYPFVPSAAADIPLDDFARLFAPNGLIDGFFNTDLKPFVDTTGVPWKAQDAGGVPAPVRSADLAQFQRASLVRQMFFPGNAPSPTLRLEITPVSLDAGSRQLTLDLGGGTLSYAHGPSRATRISWPNQGGSSARLVLEPVSGGPPSVFEATGPWALFRLIAQGTLRPDGAPDRYTLEFQQDGHRAIFSVRTGSVVNPFASPALREFRCPAL